MQYREHKILITTIKLLLLVGDEKKLSKFTETYGVYTDNVNSEDVNEWINAVSKIKIKYRRFNSSCLLLSFWGSYFSDKQFEDLYANLKADFVLWTEEQYAGDLISKAYLSVLEKNQYRITQKDFLEVSYRFFEKGLKRWYDDVFGKVKVPVKEISKVLNAALGTLRAERQTLESKVDAWKLITIIFMMYPKAKCVKEASVDINKNLDACLQGKDILLSSGYNESSLRVVFQFWKMFTNQI